MSDTKKKEGCEAQECPEVQAVVDAAEALANAATGLKCDRTADVVQSAAATAAAAVGYDLNDVCEPCESKKEPCEDEKTE